MFVRFSRLVPHLVATLSLLAAPALFASAALGEDLADIGYVDQAQLSNVPRFAAANRQLLEYRASLDRQFQARLRGVRNPSDQARIAQEFQNKMAERQRAVLGPLFARAQVAIASVASTKNLSVVVDKSIVIVGGQDITRNVIDLFNGVGDPVPPVNSPPPSSVGFVDQNAINALPKVKSINDDFAKFQNQEQADVQKKMRSAKNDAERQQILKDMQKALLDKKKSTVDPMVDQIKNAIADVAKKRNLLLVIDRTHLIYGGTDITSDVTDKLK